MSVLWWILHQWPVLVVIVAIVLVVVTQPAIAVKHEGLLIGILAIVLAGQFIYDRGAAATGPAVNAANTRAATAEQNAATAEATADVSDRARTAMDSALGTQHAKAQATLGVIDERIRVAPKRAAEPDDAGILRAVAAAHDRAEAAAAAVRGTPRAQPDPEPAAR